MKNIFLSFLLLLFIVSCGESNHSNASSNVKNTEFVFKKDGELVINDSLNNSIATFNIELATDAYKRETGLMYRKSMQPQNAMLFIFEQEKPLYFYMKNTYIPLDIIYINEKMEVVSIAKNAKPLDETTLPSQFPARYVLEVNAGIADQFGIKKGNTVSW